jgi:hypothetical protein
MRLVLILLGMLLAQPVWAEWLRLGETNGTSSEIAFAYYFDPATVRKTPNGRRAWAMWSYEQIQDGSFGRHQTKKILYEFDCAEERLRVLQLSFTSGPMGIGESVFSEAEPAPWIAPSPSTINEGTLKAVCKVRLK